MKTILFAVWIFLAGAASGQVGIGTATPNPKSALEIKDSTRGVLIPRMTWLQRAAINLPPDGLMVYQTDSTKGFWHFDGVKWNHIYSSAVTSNVGGKAKLVLSDTITNAQAQAIIDADFGPNTQELYIMGCDRLTSFSLPALTTSTNVFVCDNPILNTLNLQNLRACTGHVYVQNCPLLSNLNLNSLQNVILSTMGSDYAFVIQKTRVSNLTFPSLKRVSGAMAVTDNGQLVSINLPALSNPISVLAISNNSSLTSISIPLLTSCGGLWMESNISLPTITLPALQKLNYFYIFKHASLTSINFPALTQIVAPAGYCKVNQSPNVTSVRFDNLIQFLPAELDLTWCKLPSTEINYILAKFVSISPAITGKRLSLAQLVSAPPTGQGIIDRATLVANGNTVIPY